MINIEKITHLALSKEQVTKAIERYLKVIVSADPKNMNIRFRDDHSVGVEIIVQYSINEPESE